jgi:ATP-dependent helicase Lhr and Lhr-like helicase
MADDGTTDNLADAFEPYVWEWFTGEFGAASPPQRMAWPRIAAGQHTLIFAPTGSGKTLAAFLWCINDLFRRGREATLEDAVQVLYVSPLKALNNDIQKNLIAPLDGIRARAEANGLSLPEVRSAVRTGDTPQDERRRMVERPPQILITTPESLAIILATSRFRDAFRTVRYVIVDEIHAMVANKRGVDLSLSLERLRHLCRRCDEPFTRIGLSATQHPLETVAAYLTGVDDAGQPRPCAIVDAGGRKTLDVEVVSPVDNLMDAQFDAVWGSAYAYMASMIRDHTTTLVFHNSRYKTERTALRLNEATVGEPVRVGAHHGSMSKAVRLSVETDLKDGALDAVVATASLELGIDVGSIDLVCQVQSPKSVSTGLQRVGRAGHLLNATTKGRVLAVDGDDLIEAAVVVRAMLSGDLEAVRVPERCLDVLAQHVVGAVAADDWTVEGLYDLLRGSYCYRELTRAEFDSVLDLLAGNAAPDVVEPAPRKIVWDKVRNELSAEPDTRVNAFLGGGTIPDIVDYDIYWESKGVRVGSLDEGFVEKLNPGDVFILGSSSWAVTRVQQERVLVEEIYGLPPTIPYWGGDRDSRTCHLGLLVGQFRAAAEPRVNDDDFVDWIRAETHVDANGAACIAEYLREQHAMTGMLPTDENLLVEHFQDEHGATQVVIHSCLGVRVNDAWAIALSHAIELTDGRRAIWATTDDGILLGLPRKCSVGPDELPGLVRADSVDDVLRSALLDSPAFAARFRHVAVRAMAISRQMGRQRTPVWIQNRRAAELLEACRDDMDDPLVAETLRECVTEAIDGPNLKLALARIESGEITSRVVETIVPSPFTHSVLLLGEYGDMDAVSPGEERRRTMQLREQTREQIVRQQARTDLLDPAAVGEVVARLQRTAPDARASDAEGLLGVLQDIGDLTHLPADDISLADRVDGNEYAALSELIGERRIVYVPVGRAERHRDRWIAAEEFPLYRAAFASSLNLDDLDRDVLQALADHGPASADDLPLPGRHANRLHTLALRYETLRLPGASERYVAARDWLPAHVYDEQPTGEEARRALIERLLRTSGPVTKYELMERYGLPGALVEGVLQELAREGIVFEGEYVASKPFPQWCHRRNLDDIRRITAARRQKDMDPATPEQYADFLIRWQRLHPDTRLSGVDGVRHVLRQLQGMDNFQLLLERDVLSGRVHDYDPAMLDALCESGEVAWRRFAWKAIKRGQFGFAFAEGGSDLLANPATTPMELNRWDSDIPDVCGAVREWLAAHGPSDFDDIVEGTGCDWRQVLRAVWHLAWTGEATNACYESVRHMRVGSGLSACYDLATHPGSDGVTDDFIVHHMLDLRQLDPRLAPWAPTERIAPEASPGASPEASEDAHELADPETWVAAWADQLLQRYGVVTRETLKQEPAAPTWTRLKRVLNEWDAEGRVLGGFFVDGLAVEQYALETAVAGITEAKLRAPSADEISDDEPMLAVNLCDPANPFPAMFPLTDEAGEPVKAIRTPHRYVVMQAGRPLLLYQNAITVLADMPRERAERAVQALCKLVDEPASVEPVEKLRLRDWNGHPVDVSVGRPLLDKLGFVERARHEYFYDGQKDVPRDDMRALSSEIPREFERAGRADAPVEYDEAWMVSRAPDGIWEGVRAAIDMLRELTSDEYEFVFQARDLVIRYRGERAAYVRVGQKQAWVHVTHGGWVRPVIVATPEDCDDEENRLILAERFVRTRAAIDAKLDEG